jgi:asparagine synthetase B (glutamine-hydrolysing)
LYIGTNGDLSNTIQFFASELKALVNHVDLATVAAVPAGHFWRHETGLVRYHNPSWLYGNPVEMTTTVRPFSSMSMFGTF